MPNLKTRLNKTLFLLTFILFITTQGYSKSRTSSEALDLANSFSQKVQSTVLKSSSGNRTVSKLAYTCIEKEATRSGNQNAYYYIFDIGEKNGFVVVSGDDRAKNILGYADSGSFSTENMPENFRCWMAFYEKELKALAAKPEDTILHTTILKNIQKSPSSIFETSVAPLLGTIKWDQSDPYNIFCPIVRTEKAPTGCVATAMAQIMKYHEWPVTGTGSKTYKSSLVADSLSVDFSKTTYDWANMLNIYNGSGTAIQDTAVATLMYHCGVALSMEYDVSSSGAFSNDCPSALSTYFGYDENAQIYTRDYYSEAEWTRLIKTELNEKRPILYGGSDADYNGHAFVCDGYDSSNLFHFNWGWSGSFNGYFELSSLKPSDPGMGGGYGGYSIGQDMTIGIQKPTESSVKSNQILLYKNIEANKSIVSRDSTFNMNFGFANYGGNTFEGHLALGLYQGDSLVLKLDETQDMILGTYMGDTNYTTDSLAIPSSLSDGSYQLYSIYQEKGQSDWSMMRNKIGLPNSLNVSINAAEITFTTPDVFPKLTLTEQIKVTGKLYSNKTLRLSATIQNTGGEFNSYLIFMLSSTTDSKMVRYVNFAPVNIPSETTKTLEITGKTSLPAGEYTLTLLYDLNNDQYNESLIPITPLLNNSLLVNIIEASNEAPALTLTEKLSLAQNVLVKGSEAFLTAKVKNTGGYFNSYLMAYVFPSTGNSSIDYLGPIEVIMDTNEEKMVTFRKDLNLEDGSYQMTLFAYNTTVMNGWAPFSNELFSKISFTVNNLQTNLEEASTEKPGIFPNPVTDVLHVQSADIIHSLVILDITGKQILKKESFSTGTLTMNVNDLDQGVYLLKIETGKGTFTEKFVKNR